MNIFAVDICPVAAAEALPDKLVVKMPIETAQILSTVSHLLGVPGPYRKTHQHHPCVKWAGESLLNWMWVVDHGRALCDEYRYRYGRLHACEEVIEEIAFDCAHPMVGYRTAFVLAMPDSIRLDETLAADPICAYRAYMRKHKAHYARWTRRAPPTWWAE